MVMPNYGYRCSFDLCHCKSHPHAHSRTLAECQIMGLVPFIFLFVCETLWIENVWFWVVFLVPRIRSTRLSIKNGFRLEILIFFYYSHMYAMHWDVYCCSRINCHTSSLTTKFGKHILFSAEFGMKVDAWG